MEKILFTSESVTEGHPDKICDQISDAVLDAILTTDPNARVACETTVTRGLVLISGEITTNTYVDIQSIARNTIRDIGYTRAKYGFDADSVGVMVSIGSQSPDIAAGVDNALETRDENESDLGAGDQGIMFGYATNENEEYMPTPIVLAHKLAHRLAKIRKEGIVDYLRPDGKRKLQSSTMKIKTIKRVDTIVISTQHDPKASNEEIEVMLKERVIKEVIPSNLVDEETKIFINPSGKFVIGGPHGDAGLTGRKIIVDTYGGYARHGGGAFSGKDATKVDRSAAYAARWVAKNLVAAGIADKLEIQLSYAIGMAYPTSISVDTYNTSKKTNQEIVEIIRNVFDLRPSAIIRDLNLKSPIYNQVAAYGHFGRIDLDLPWEKLNKVNEIKLAMENK